MPVVSVVIPTYNGSRYILKTIESVLGQSYRDFEIIVVDDGSEENIRQLLEPLAGKVTYIRLTNYGPAAARNVGIRACGGEFVALLDHDDVWAVDNLWEKVEALQKNPDCAMVYSYPELIDADGAAITQEYPVFFPSGSVFENFLLRNWITTFSCTLIRKSVFEKVGFLDERREIMCCDDYDMWLRIADVGQILFSPDKNVYYRIHPQNLLKNYDISLNSTLAVFKKALKSCRSASMIPEKQLSRIVREHLYKKYWDYGYRYYYEKRNYRKTRELLRRCLMMKPFNLQNWKYFLICLIPPPILDRLRGIRRSN